MTERLIIHNFASITELNIEIKKINIIIGPQASGKSICTKLLFYFKSFPLDLVRFIENGKTIVDLLKIYQGRFEEFFPKSCWGSQGFYIRHETHDFFIQVAAEEHLDLGFGIQYSEHYEHLAKELTQIYKKGVDSMSDLDLSDERDMIHSKMLTHASNRLQPESFYPQLFIPAARSFFYMIQSNIFSLMSNNITIDPFLQRFGAIYESAKKSYSSDRTYESKTSQNEIEHHINEILCGEYQTEKGKEFLMSVDGRKTPISFASSGQQEALPLLVVLLSMPKYNRSSAQGMSVYIEEPEAHLFPTAQKKIIEVISMIFNSCEGEPQFFITTHSPYVLTALNNLIEAGLLYDELPEESRKQLESIVPRYKALNPKQMKVYSLESGYAQSIISDETGLIDTNIIDEVSNELSIEFGNLLDLEN